jgi:hypothetical protein
MDELIERIRTAQEKMLEEKLTANTFVLNGKKYGCLFEFGYRPSICGLTAELANLPDNMDFIVQYRVPQPKTNADRIRSMSDEELADWLVMNGNGEDYKTWLDWLKQEAKDD